MHKSFSSLNELFVYIKEDKEWQGVNIAQHNRYPIRFVLFDNFADFTEFIENKPGDIYNYSLDTLLNKDYPDTFASYSELANEIIGIVRKLPAFDLVLFPFSEMTRFYTVKNFESLVKTIRLKQPPEDSQNDHIRIYIPIVGMQGKMSQFFNDGQAFVWEVKGSGEHGLYNLIITNGTTYNVSGLHRDYSVVGNLSEWLQLWKKGGQVKQTIICTSRSIYDSASNAQPDNAFTYIECHNAFEFLTKGLKLDFGETPLPSEEDLKYWEQLAELIDIENFNFDSFIKERFDTYHLMDSMDFIKAWEDCNSDFDRWLLILYFRKITNGVGYVSYALSKCTNLSTSELFSNIATAIFELPLLPKHIDERRKAMQWATAKNVKITETAENKIVAKLKAIVANPEQGVYIALQLLTSLTEGERCLAVQWIGEGRIMPSKIQSIFPDLYYYLAPMTLSLAGENAWINGYFDAYRAAKMANETNDKIKEFITSKNGNTSSFLAWKDGLKTVRTILHNRNDIEVYYWIDGLGVDWVPFIIQVIKEHAHENVYLNEVYVASSALPTTTSVNKPILESLVHEGEKLPKIGDLDSFAHQHKKYPQYVIEELDMVRKAIHDVLSQYNGKKIAFVSDHGLTYLSQREKGLKLAGFTGEHEGRLAYVEKKPVADNKYYILEPNNCVCALTHASLTDKVTSGHGAHGGCTPEEVLVPIIIVSSQKNASNYSVKLVADDINGNNPVVEFTIKGLNSIDVPILEYNGTTYRLNPLDKDLYCSERLNLVDTAKKVIVKIGDSYKSSFTIQISTGAIEDDPFGF